MRMNYTNSDLLNFHEQFLAWDKNRSALILLNRSKINEFYKNYTAKIQTLYKKMDELKRNYYVYETPLIIEGQPQKEPVLKLVGEGNDAKTVLQEGKLEITMQQELAELLNTKIEIHI